MEKNVLAQTFGASHKHFVISFAEYADPRSAGIASSAQKHSSKPRGGSTFHADCRRRGRARPIDRGSGFAGVSDRIPATFGVNGRLACSLFGFQAVCPFSVSLGLRFMAQKRKNVKRKLSGAPGFYNCIYYAIDLQSPRRTLAPHLLTSHRNARPAPGAAGQSFSCPQGSIRKNSDIDVLPLLLSPCFTAALSVLIFDMPGVRHSGK